MEQSPCVSLYLPTHSTGRARRQDQIRLTNLVREARLQIEDQPANARQLDSIISPIERLSDGAEWKHRGDGLAVFSAEGFFRSFSLPMHCCESVVVDDRFHVGPLLPLLQANRRYFLLALTKESADLYEASRESLTERELPTMAPIAVDGEKQPLQHHSYHAPSQGRGGTSEAMYHGQGGPSDRERADLENFFKRQVAEGVENALHGQQAPLVLACDDSLVPLYRDANAYPYLADNHISGSPVEMDAQELCARGWQIMESSMAEHERMAQERFDRLGGTDRTSIELGEIIEAAKIGRVEILMVSDDVVLSPEGSTAESSETRLTEYAIEQTILNSGEVLAVDNVPGEKVMAAVYRY